jgi:very-short-patch-repair endonuclease
MSSTERARTLRKRMPEPELRVWTMLRALRPLGFHFRRQVALGPYFADFACHHAHLVIEVDGDTHGSDAAVGRDRARDAFIRGEGYEVVRVPNGEVMGNPDGVRRLIWEAVKGRPRTALRAGRNPHP